MELFAARDQDHRTLVELAVPARPECVIRARQAVAVAGERAGLSPDRVDDLVIAVSEACTNAIEAQLAAGNAEPVRLRCDLDPWRLTVSIRDRGHGFDPLAVAARPRLSDPLHLHAERGWGLQLMRGLVDAVVLEPSPSGTTVHLVVDRPGGDEPADWPI